METRLQREPKSKGKIHTFVCVCVCVHMLCDATEDMFRWEFIVSGAYLKEKKKG